MSTIKRTKMLEMLLGSYPGWDAAIADAQEQALEAEQRAVRLRAVASVMARK